MPLPNIFGTRKKNPPSPAAPGAKPGGNPVEEMFNNYKEPDEDRIGPEGIMKLCGDMSIEPTDVRLLVLAWQLNAAQQGYFSRKEWMIGLENMRDRSASAIDSPQALLERLQVFTSSLRHATSNEMFKKFYRFAFIFSRTPGQKSLEIDTVKVLLPMVLPPQHPHLDKLLLFLESSSGSSIKAFNEDQWTSFLLFSNQISRDFSNFDPDGAWPSLLDDYVAFAAK